MSVIEVYKNSRAKKLYCYYNSNTTRINAPEKRHSIDERSCTKIKLLQKSHRQSTKKKKWKNENLPEKTNREYANDNWGGEYSTTRRDDQTVAPAIRRRASVALGTILSSRAQPLLPPTPRSMKTDRRRRHHHHHRPACLGALHVFYKSRPAAVTANFRRQRRGVMCNGTRYYIRYNASYTT